MTINDFLSALQKTNVGSVTFTLDNKNNPVCVARQQVRNRSGLMTEATHAHTGTSFADAAGKVLKDAEHCANLESKVLRLNAN